MKRKGFTLIELLAVIVILAVIALIATPMIMDVIEKSKKGAAESSADGYISAVEQYKIVSQLDGDKSLEDGTYTVSELASYNIEVKGKKPSDGTIVISSGKIMDYQLQFDQYVVTYDSEQQKGVAEKKEYEVTEIKKFEEVTLADGSRWYIIEEDDTTVMLFSMYNINVTTNKQDNTLTGDADDVQAVQFDDESRNNENNTYCQIASGDLPYSGCNAYAAVEGVYDSAKEVMKAYVNEITGKTDYCGTETSETIIGTVTEDSNVKKYIDLYVESLNLGDNLISYGLLPARKIVDLGSFISQPCAGAPVRNTSIPEELESTSYWVEYNDFVIVGMSPFLSNSGVSGSGNVQYKKSNSKSGVRPMIVVKKSAIQ